MKLESSSASAADTLAPEPIDGMSNVAYSSTPPFIWAWCQRQERKRYARGRQLVGRGRASRWARTGSYGSERLMRKERKQLTLVAVYFAKGTQCC